MTFPDPPRLQAGPAAGAQTAWSAEAERAEVRPAAAAAPPWDDWSLAYASSGADETTMNSPCL